MLMTGDGRQIGQAVGPGPSQVVDCARPLNSHRRAGAVGLVRGAARAFDITGVARKSCRHVVKPASRREPGNIRWRCRTSRVIDMRFTLERQPHWPPSKLTGKRRWCAGGSGRGETMLFLGFENDRSAWNLAPKEGGRLEGCRRMYRVTVYTMATGRRQRMQIGFWPSWVKVSAPSCGLYHFSTTAARGFWEKRGSTLVG